MITASGLELRAGARILLSDTTLRVQPGDRIGSEGDLGLGKRAPAQDDPIAFDHDIEQFSRFQS